MEAALRSILKDTLGDYVKGQALQKSDLSNFPLVLRDLVLNEKKVQAEWDELNESAVQLSAGKIGSIKVTPGWMGTIDVVATNIELTFSFSPLQAAKNQLKPRTEDADWNEEAAAPAPQEPPAMCPPRFCCAHDSSEKRVKGDPEFKECKKCGITLQSSYKDFQFCPPCSEKDQKCMICGSNAPKSSSYMPGAPQPTQAQSSGQAPATDRQSRPQPAQGQSGGQAPAAAGQSRSQPAQVPPPPPPPPASGRRGDAASNCRSRGDVNTMPETNRSQHQRHRSGEVPSATPQTRQRAPMPPPPPQTQQVWQTQLPPSMAQAAAHGQRPNAAEHWPNTSLQRRDDSDDGFAGFLRFVATDLWKTCNSDNGGRMGSPEGTFPAPPRFQGRGGA